MKQIITEIYTDKNLKSLAKKLAGDNWEDLLHEVVLICYEKPDPIITAWEGGYMRMYIARMLMWTYESKYSNYRKSYHPPHCELKEVPEITNDEITGEEEKILQYLLGAMESNNMAERYPARLLNRVVELGSVSQAARVIGIPRKTIDDTIKMYINYLKSL